MKKILSILLLLSLLLLCFSGCTTPTDPQGGTETDPESTPVTDETDPQGGTETDPESAPVTDETDPEDPNEGEKVELNEELNHLFAELQSDSNKLEKIRYYIDYQDLHYQLKESGKYDDERWIPSAILVYVNCNYDLATEEDWYKACLNTDLETLNTAFFNEYSHELSEGHFVPLGILPTLLFEYEHSASTLSETVTVFYSDYAVLKRLISLEYVTSIYVQYVYSVPGSYFDQ